MDRRSCLIGVLGLPAALKFEPPQLYSARPLTPVGSFGENIEGPACDENGILYVPNFARDHTIGRIWPKGNGAIFTEIPEKGMPCGSRYNGRRNLLVTDAANHKILRISLDNAAVQVFAHNPQMHQPNDLAVAADGSIFASDPDWTNKSGRVWRIDAQGRSTIAVGGMGSTNGIELNPSETILYVNEFDQKRICVFDVGPGGQLSGKRELIRFTEHGLDGMRCDADGNLYVTRWGNGTVAKVSPSGEVLREIAVLGTQPTNLCFGGPDGCTAYVTEAERRRLVSFRVERPGSDWLRIQRVMRKR